MASRRTAPKKKRARPAAKKKRARLTAKKKGAAQIKAKAVDRLREICLSLPEATEVEAWGTATFRVRNKIFAMYTAASSHNGKGRESVWIAADSTTQDLVLRAKPDLYFSPPYVGPSGWIGAWIDRRPAWGEIVDFLRDAYRKKATKKQIAQMEEG